MKHKRYQVESVKALGADAGEAAGTFEAVVAVFDNVDHAGDRIKSGAFDRTLEAWQASGDPIPVILEHQWGDPFAHIGYANPADVKSVPGRGLVVKGQLDIEDNPVAKQVYKLMERRSMREFSFGYTVAPGGEKKAADGAYDLTDVTLFEFGPCLKGVNPDTELLSVKSALEEQAERETAPKTKSYLDVELEGTYEQTQGELREAIAALYPDDPAGQRFISVSIVGTYSDRVVYQVCVSTPAGYEDEIYSIEYIQVADEYQLDEPTLMTVDLVAVPEPAEPAGAEADEIDTAPTKSETEEIEVKAYSSEQRAEMAKQGEAIPVKNADGEIVDGRYPIANTSDLSKAIQAIGRVAEGDRAEVIRHIKKRARALGATDAIPEDWKAISADTLVRVRVAALDQLEADFGFSSSALEAAEDVLKDAGAIENS